MPSPVSPPVLPDTIETNRLILRPVELSDAPAMSRYMSDYDISKMTSSFPFPVPLLSAEFWIMKARANKFRGKAYPYVIERRDTPGLCGKVDIFKNAEQQWEFGYWLARPFWGHGFITEAARGLMEAFERVNGPTRFTAGIYEDNPASGRVLEKLGFTKTGPSPELFSMARLCKASGYRYDREIKSAL